MFKAGHETKLFIPHCGLRFELTDDCEVNLAWDWPVVDGNCEVLIKKGHIVEKEFPIMGRQRKKGAKLFSQNPLDYVEYDTGGTRSEYYFADTGKEFGPGPDGFIIRTVLIPASTRLKVTKLRVLNNGREKDYITFQIAWCPDSDFRKGSRITMALAEAYKMNIRLLEDAVPSEGYYARQNSTK